MTITCDTSVLVAGLASWHEGHEQARAALRDVSIIGAHVLTETYSVLTRLPEGMRIDARSAGAALTSLRWDVVGLPAEDRVAGILRFADAGISGGAVYDAVVAATAQHHGLTLLSRDRRAKRTYDALRVDYRMV